MDATTQILATSIASVLASSGFWAFIQRKDSTKRATARLLMGLAYDKITTLGLSYIERGHITKDEFEELRRYLYEPYKELGGNGVADRIMAEVGNLPLLHQSRYSEIIAAKKANRRYDQ